MQRKSPDSLRTGTRIIPPQTEEERDLDVGRIRLREFARVLIAEPAYVALLTSCLNMNTFAVLTAARALAGNMDTLK